MEVTEIKTAKEIFQSSENDKTIMYVYQGDQLLTD